MERESRRADSRATVADPAGLDIEALIALKKAGKNVGEYAAGQKLDRDAVIGIDCDIWIPAARPDVVRADNVEQLKAKLVVEGANIPVTAEAEAVLHARGVLVIPDFIANAGGVICGAVEYAGGGQRQAFDTIEEKIRENTRAVLEASRDDKVAPREAANALARERVEAAMALRRWA